MRIHNHRMSSFPLVEMQKSEAYPEIIPLLLFEVLWISCLQGIINSMVDGIKNVNRHLGGI
jgi:hypothetical protein